MKKITLDNLHSHYWLKVELQNFCRQKSITSQGAKTELVKCIEAFLKTGDKIQPKQQRSSVRDSDALITLTTRVINYKNDLITRNFFKSIIGKRFHFTAHVNAYREAKLAAGEKLTYGDLVKEWLAEEARRKTPNYQSMIPRSCEYNQFSRNFYAKNIDGKHSDMVKAWHKEKARRNKN